MSFLGLGLALASSLVWGAADFAGGSLTRRLPAFAITLASQAAGFAALLVAVALRGDVDRHSLALGMIAGVGGGVGLAAFYRALSLGTMSVVSPLVACGAIMPFGISIATGERPSHLAVAGALLAVAGAVLASLEERRAASSDRARAIALAVLAAAALGLFTYFLGLGTKQGDALSTLVGARIGSLTLLLLIAGSLRATISLPRGAIWAVAAVGLADVTANALFAVASDRALLSLVSVLGSLYPLATVVLAHVLLGERLTREQQLGIAVALAGVVAISAG